MVLSLQRESADHHARQAAEHLSQPPTGIVQRQSADDVHWRISSGWENLLLGPDGLRLPQWLREGRAQVVKDGAHRTVYRVDLPGKTVYLKHYRCQRWQGMLRHVLRASASRREWHKTIEVARRRIPTALPVACGELLRGGLVLDNFFVSEEIHGSQSVDQFYAERLPQLDVRAQACYRRKLLKAVARLTAELHRAGVYHNDFHTGNLLVQFDDAVAARGGRDVGEPSVYVIDLPSVGLSKGLSWKRSRDSLVMLLSGWLNRLSRADRWRFFREYLAGRPDLQVEPRAAATEIHQRTRGYARHILSGRDKRALANNRDFYRLSAHGCMGHAVQDLSPEHLAALMQSPRRLIEQHRNAPVKLSHSSLIVEAVLPVACRLAPIAYKRWRPKTWWKQIAAWARPGRSLAGWYRGQALLQRGIATARPLAAFETRARGWSREGYLATAWVENAENLHLYGWRLAELSASERFNKARQCAESLGRLLGRMHGWRIGHRDLKACNLLISEREQTVDALLIDLDGLRMASWLGHRSRARDLSRLATSMEAHGWLSRGMRLRFLRAYLREFDEPGEDWKRLWRDIARYSRRNIAQLRRRNQPIV